MTRTAWALLVALATACAGGSQSVHGERVRVVATANTGKKLTIYKSAAYRDTEKKPVPEDVVVQAMHASGSFFEEDIRALSAGITQALADLDVGERVVVETSDMQIHIYVAGGELQIAGYRDDQEVSRHASAIHGDAVQTTLTGHPGRIDATPTAVSPAAVSPPPQQPAIVVVPTPAANAATTSPLTAGSDASQPPVHLGESEVRRRLAELDRLLAKHLITQGEYDQKRKALLDQL